MTARIAFYESSFEHLESLRRFLLPKPACAMQPTVKLTVAGFSTQTSRTLISVTYTIQAAVWVFTILCMLFNVINIAQSCVCDTAVVIYLNLRWPCATPAVRNSNHTTFDSIGIAKRMSTVHRIIGANLSELVIEAAHSYLVLLGWNLDIAYIQTVWPKFTRFETVSGYVTLITVYNPSRTLWNICNPLRSRKLNTLDHTAWWPSEAPHWLNG